jgi:hypothetical protein
MQIDQKHLAYKKQVGTLKGKPVFELATTGGLHVMVSGGAGGGFQVISSGPHPGVARYMAEKREPDIQLTELSKSEQIEPYLFLGILPEYEKLTDMLQKSWGKK